MIDPFGLFGGPGDDQITASPPPTWMEETWSEIKGFYWGALGKLEGGPGTSKKWKRRSDEFKEGVGVTLGQPLYLLDDVQYGQTGEKLLDRHSVVLNRGLEEVKGGGTLADAYGAMSFEMAKQYTFGRFAIGRTVIAANSVKEVYEGVKADDWKQVGGASPGLALLPEAAGTTWKYAESATNFLSEYYPDPSTAGSGGFTWRRYSQGPRRFSGSDKAEGWAMSGGKCEYCGKQLTRVAGKPNSIELDHLVPYREGGPTNPENRVTSCLECNRQKGGKDPIQWFMDQENKK